MQRKKKELKPEEYQEISIRKTKNGIAISVLMEKITQSEEIFTSKNQET